MSRPHSDRDGPCICNYGPGTDGPDECCPFHGRPYAYWIERGDALQARLDALTNPTPTAPGTAPGRDEETP